MFSRRQQKGSILIQLIVSAGLILGIVLSFVSVLSQVSTITQKSSQSVIDALPHADVIGRARRVFFDTKNNLGEHKLGLCALIYPKTLDRRLVPIVVDFASAKSTNALPLARWLAAFGPDWEADSDPANCEHLDDFPLTLCLKQSAALAAREQRSVPLKVKVTVEALSISPQGSLPVYSTVDFSLLGRVLDVKAVAFSIASFVTAPAGANADEHSSEVKELAWAADAGSCDYVQDGKSVVLNATGTGLGGILESDFYNRMDFSAAGVDPIQVEYQRRAVQKGLLDQSRIVTDVAQNAEISCNEMRYRCPNGPSSRKLADGMEATISVVYSPDNKCFTEPQIKAVPQVKILKNGTGSDLAAGLKKSYTLDGDTYVEAGDGKFYQADANNDPDKTRPFLLTSQHVLGVTLDDSASGSGLCQQICKDASTANAYVANLIMTTKGGSCGPYWEGAFASSRIACTACYMRNCSRFGLDTFGPVTTQPPEPLDGAVPECVLNDAAESDFHNYGSGMSTTAGVSGCLAGSFTGTKFQVEVRDCTEKLPVLCYNYGGFLLARQVTPTAVTYDALPFSQGSRRCYEMGREVVSQSGLAGLFSQYKVAMPVDLPPAAGADYDFVNNAKQGLFVAPQTTGQWDQLKSWWLIEKPKVGHFWLALRANTDNALVAVPPMLSTQAQAGDEFALYFTPTGPPELVRDTDATGGLVTGSDVLVLEHDLRRKGALGVHQSQPTQLHFLCQKSTNFFISAAKHNSATQGEAICKIEGGLFLPPVTPIGWAQALNKTRGLSPDFPFPDPEIAAPPGVFVALSPNGVSLPGFTTLLAMIGDVSASGGATSWMKPSGAFSPSSKLSPFKISCRKNVSREVVFRTDSCNADESVFNPAAADASDAAKVA